jgi:hypothetical protein
MMATAGDNTIGNARDGMIMQRISWTGVVTGVIAGLIIQVALLVLGLAIGLVSITNLENLGGMAITAGIWLAISWAVAAFVAGLTASRAAGYLTVAQGRFNGLVTGMVMLIVSTTFTAGLISSVVNSATGAVKSVATVAAGAVGGAATATGNAVADNGGLAGTLQSLGLGDAYQAVTSGLNDTELNQIIADASPELNQTQVAAVTNVIRGIITTSSRDLGTALQNPSELPNFVNNRVDSISKALSGDQFVSRLQRRGLSKVQAQEVETVISKRVATLRTQGEQAAQAASDQAQQIARDAASTAGKAAWIWLLLAGLVLGLASYGGGFGNDANPNGRLVNTGLEESTRTYRPSRP